MKITTVKGTNDYKPEEVRLRDYLQSKITEIYTNSGFEHIVTPAIEDIDNLDKSEGGENLNLIFKILKRGDKLARAFESGDCKSLSDMGLRYDLTLPLSRYYANNKSELILPFKTIQIDRVYRAERPQKGRLREFIQCDIDIIGSESHNCEIELIYTTAKALLAINIGSFKIRVNDRRVLKAVLKSMGFKSEELDSVCIVFDKLDKIGSDGVCAELKEKGFDEEAINKFAGLISRENITFDDIEAVVSDDSMEYIDRLKNIIDRSTQIAAGKYEVVFDISLVRGQGYYTGTIFEVESTKFSGAIAGGGRYDNLIGKFTNENIPAVGFSIGFERIFSILSEQGYVPEDTADRVAVFYNPDGYTDALGLAEKLREMYDVTLIERPKKLGKFLDKLEKQNYYGYVVYGEAEEVKVFAAH
ncbi:MAG: histidine--tRNA ligase [Lachnospiraceae bacterium]|nr:histidine--tRNA ligase [Lachnospiraceae bacterium]